MTADRVGGPEPARPNVLITSAARKVPLVRAFQRATEALGGRVIAADVSPLAAALYEADDARLLPRSDRPGFIDALLELCERDAVGLVIPTRDEELPLLAEARDRFRAAGTLVLVSAPEPIERCQDKVRFGDAVAAAGLETPRTFVDHVDVRYPAFVKPRRGKGGLGARAVANEAELHAAIEAAGGEVVIQELIEAPEFTLDAFLDLDRRPISCVPRERTAVVAGESIVTRSVRDPELVAAALRLCDVIGLVGHVTVQAFRTAERILFIEVNPRYGGAANLGFEAGARTPDLAVRMARGERLEPQLDDYEAGLTMLRSASDRFVRDADLIDATPVPDTLPELRWRAVIFDLDDTLYPEHQFVDGGFRAVAELIARELGGSTPPSRLHERLWALHARDGRGRLFDGLLDETGRGADPGLVLTAVLAYRGHTARLTPFVGIEGLVRRLRGRGARLGLLSDGLSGVQRRKLAALGPLATRFDAVVMTDELGPGHAKPSPDGFRVACRLLGVQPDEAVYVGNDPRKDFRGAREAGLATIRFGSRPVEGGVDTSPSAMDDSDHTADSVEDLGRLLLGTDSATTPEVPR